MGLWWCLEHFWWIQKSVRWRDLYKTANVKGILCLSRSEIFLCCTVGFESFFKFCSSLSEDWIVKWEKSFQQILVWLQIWLDNTKDPHYENFTRTVKCWFHLYIKYSNLRFCSQIRCCWHKVIFTFWFCSIKSLCRVILYITMLLQNL